MRYDPETGRLFWQKRDDVTQRWNARFPGKEAFTSCDGHGYRRGKINGRDYQAHRVIWAMQTGAWPVSEIDHINGVKTDNRMQNLREATRSQNQHNKGVNAHNSIGLKGVSPYRDRWQARIAVNGVNKHLGIFATPSEAHQAYCAAAKRLHGEFARTA